MHEASFGVFEFPFKWYLYKYMYIFGNGGMIYSTLYTKCQGILPSKCDCRLMYLEVNFVLKVWGPFMVIVLNWAPVCEP